MGNGHLKNKELILEFSSRSVDGILGAVLVKCFI